MNPQDIALKVIGVGIDLARGVLDKNSAAEQLAALHGELLAIDAAVDAAENETVDGS